jgi:rare lipoprotein A (peptidoglycan hydrolase)
MVMRGSLIGALLLALLATPFAKVEQTGQQVAEIGRKAVETTAALPSLSLQAIQKASLPLPVVTPPKDGFRELGTASWYGAKFHGKKMASGKKFDRMRLTAAHPTLPLGTKARIINLENGRFVEVTVTDRGPYVRGRIIDLSERAAELLGMTKNGVAGVVVEADGTLG